MFFLVFSVLFITMLGVCFLSKKCNKTDIIFLLIGYMTFPICSYMFHTEDLGTLRAQSYVINVYEKRIEELNAQLKAIVPEGKQTNIMLLNADSPIKGIVDSVSQANKELADARVVEAQAKVSIEKRKAGVFSFIVSICGEK